jgi:hypothetical protein
MDMSQNDQPTPIARLDEIVQVLEHIRRRPASYFGGAVSPFDNFISGFNVACYLFVDRTLLAAALEDVLKSRSIEKPFDKSLFQTLHESGLSDEEAADGTLGLMVEACKKVRAQLAEGQG